MKAVLSNAILPSCGVANIPFPIFKAEYDHCIFILNALEIGDAINADCKVEEISEGYPVLKRLEGTVASTYPLLALYFQGFFYMAQR